jgi:hypothetical protein
MQIINGIKFIRVLNTHRSNPALHIHDWREYGQYLSYPSNDRYIFKVDDFKNNPDFKDYDMSNIVEQLTALGAIRNTAEGYRDYLVIIALNLWVFIDMLLQNLQRQKNN